MTSKVNPNHNKGQTTNNDPSLTDQSQAAQTDINIIVTQFLRTGTAPQAPNIMFADFTELPEDLRGFIEMGRSMNTLKSQLPEQLREIPPEVLFKMTDEEISDKLKPADKPENKPENNK